MKKITALLFATFIFFATFVSAQDTATLDPLQMTPVTFLVDTIKIAKGDNVSEKVGHFELTFSKEPGIIFFRDLDSLSIMKIELGEQIFSKALMVCYKNKSVPATALCFNGVTHGLGVIFTTVLLDDKDKTIYAFGITLDNYSVLIKVVK
jgi:hypothetical protein